MIRVHEVTGADDPALTVYADLNEAQLRTIYEPDRNGLFIAESPNVILRALEAGYVPESMLMERQHLTGNAKEVTEAAARRFLQHRAEESNIGPRSMSDAGENADGTRGGQRSCGETADAFPVYTGSREILKRITGFELTRGVLCAMRRRHLPCAEDILRGAKHIAVLENVENPTNVGAIFRSAAALGMDAVLLTPGCSDPLYRRAARVSMGTVFQIPWTKLSCTVEEWRTGGNDLLHAYGFTTAALALREDAVPVSDPRLKAASKLALLLGAEGDGLAAETIASADYPVIIPMAHGVDSLNVAAASAVAFWEIVKGRT